MTIQDELRYLADHCGPKTEKDNALVRAAAEIDRLTARLADAVDVQLRMMRQIEAAEARVKALEGLLESTVPMLERLAHYEGDVNQPAKAKADEIRAALAGVDGRG
jgi:phage-related minor tail protein